MNIMTAVKFLVGLAISITVFAVAIMGAKFIYGGFGHDTSEPVYVIEVEEDEPADVETAPSEPTGDTDTGETAEPEEPIAEPAEPAEPTFAELLAAADVDAGAKVFKKCKACHKTDDGANATGPHLFDIVGREKGVVEGFRYSDVMLDLGGSWTPEALNEFLIKPKDYAPGTKMSFNGIKSEEDRANLIAYLATIGG